MFIVSLLKKLQSEFGIRKSNNSCIVSYKHFSFLLFLKRIQNDRRDGYGRNIGGDSYDSFAVLYAQKENCL